MRNAIVILTVLFVGSFVSAEITVTEGFVVDTLLDQIDGQTPRLEAIRNPDYGFGVVSASVDNGILKILHISQSSLNELGTLSPLPPNAFAWDIRFDWTGLFNRQLYISLASGDNPNLRVHNDILQVSSSGHIEEVLSLGYLGDGLVFSFDFTTDVMGYSSGAYLEDAQGNGGTSLYHMDPCFVTTNLSQNLVPPGRTDLDIVGIEFDSTGTYGSYLTMADTDTNTDNWTVIYQLLPDLSWSELTTKVRTSVRQYRDMSFSSAGSFGQMLYVTDRISESIMTVDPNGIHTIFASGFSGIESVTVSEDGEHMFVSDENGVYRIRAGTTVVGPDIVMQEPKVEAEGVHTNVEGIDSLRLLFSERVLFDNSDVSLTDANDISVPFSVSGSNSQFMIIVFGETLLNDKYTITIHDSVVSVATGASIDGNNDGLAGGDAVIVMEHRERHDSDNDNDIDLIDLADFAKKWLWMD